MFYRLSCWCVLFVGTTTMAAPQAPETAPTTDQIYASLEDADYQKVLKQVAAALAVKGDLAEAYDRRELFVLRGEAQLRLKNTAAAAASFDEAARHTVLEEKAGVDRATAELIRRSKKGMYTPPAKAGQAAPLPLDVADPAARRQAFVAMFDGARPRVVATAEAARKSDKLPDILGAFALLRDLRALEIAATGSDAESTTMAKELGDRARAVMARALPEMSDTVAALGQSATLQVKDEALVAGRIVPVGQGAAGLSADEVRRLRQISSDCRRIGKIAADLSRIYDPGSREEQSSRTLYDDARAVDEGALRLLDINWRDYYHREAYVGHGAEYLDESAWEQLPPHQRPQPPSPLGTNSVQRPIRPNPNAGPRGVGTAGTK